jgi:drug/metabolite transporter (DMT)-like permease
MKENDSATTSDSIALSGLGLAALGVLAFSFTLPATVFALRGLDPYLIGIGRAGAATVLAAVTLPLDRARWPRRDQWPGLVAAGAGVVFGFPLLSTLALDHGASASHSAVVVGILPAATAVAGVVRAGERPSMSFWAASAAGTLCVTGFALSRAAGHLAPADLLLLGSVLAAAVGYAEGGRLAREMPGRQVICWALVCTGPISIPVTLWLLATTGPRWAGSTMAGFGYVTAFSMFLGFFAWYAGLGRAGIARAGQIQLAQPLLTLAWSALLLGERVDMTTAAAAAAVLGCVAWTQRARAAAPVGGGAARRRVRGRNGNRSPAA